MPKIEDLVKNGVNTYSYYQPEEKPPEDGDFVRGFKRAMYQIPETIGGTAALVGDVVGSDGLRDYGMGIYEKNHAKTQELTKASDSLTSVLEGEEGASAGDFLAGSAGYVAGQALTAVATGGAGGFIGSQLAKRGIGAMATKAAAAKAAATGAKAGAGAALFGSNLTQEAGSIYTEALAQAESEGRTLDGGDKARIIGSALTAAGVDTAADALMLKGVLKGGRKAGEGMGRAALREVPGAMAREAATEGVQTGIERYGAGQELTTAEAIRDYVDSMGVGAIGGGLGGGASVLHAQKVQESGPLTRAANTSIDEKILQLAHDPQPLISFPDGSVGHKQDMEAYLTQFTDPDERQEKERELMGRDPKTGKRIEPEPAPEPVSADSEENSKANIKAWSDKHDPVTLDYAQNLLKAPGAKGLDLMIAPHGSGKGYTVIPSKWMSLDAQAKSIAIQNGDEGRLPGPDREVPSGRIRVDSEGGAAKETYGDQSRTAAATKKAKDEADAAAARRQELGTPVPYGTKISTKPGGENASGNPDTTGNAVGNAENGSGQQDGNQEVNPGIADGGRNGGIPGQANADGNGNGNVDNALILNPKGKPFVTEFAAKRKITVGKLGETHEVKKVADGYVVQRRPADTQDEFDQAAHEAATSELNDKPQPTEAQAKAGNYAKGHVQLHGMDISIENPEGSTRSGVDRDGKPWQTTMQHHYGYLRGTVGADKDHIDTFIGKNRGSDKVFVVDQIHPDTGAFDEHKILFGFDSLKEAKAAYKANYAKNWKGGKDVSETSVEGFKAWLKDGDTKKPFKSVESDAGITASENITEVKDKYGRVHRVRQSDLDGSDERIPTVRKNGDIVTGEEIPRGILKKEQAPDQSFGKSEQLEKPQVERRKDSATRKKIADMTPDEMRVALLTDDMTQLGNRRAYEESEKKPFQASIDIDSLKWVNDNMGHASGDQLIRLIGRALKEQTADAYHLSGDEFVAQFDDEAAGAALLESVRDRLRGATIEITRPDGSTVTKTGLEFSYGIAPTLNEADTKLAADKIAREASGQRAGRGEQPLGVTERPAEGKPDNQGDAAADEVDHNGTRLYRTLIRNREEGKPPVSMWAVETAENKEKRESGGRAGMGDSLHETLDKAMAAADAQRARGESDKELDRQREEAQSRIEAEDRAIKSDTYNGFLDGRPEMAKGAIRKALSKQYRFDGEVMTVRDRVESLHAKGGLNVRTFEEPKIKPMSRAQFNRANQAQQDAHDRKMKEAGTVTTYLVNDSELGKIAYNYASHLLDQKSAITPDVKTSKPKEIHISEIKVGDQFETIQKNNIAATGGTISKIGRVNFEATSKYMGRNEVTVKLPISQLDGGKIARDGVVYNVSSAAKPAEPVKSKALQERDAKIAERDSFTVERPIDGGKDFKQETFTRGEYVEALLSVGAKSTSTKGVIDGVSQAKRQAKVNGQWFEFGLIQKTEAPIEIKPETVPLSKVIEKANAKSGSGLTEADRIMTLDGHDDAMEAARTGTISIEDFKAAYASTLANESALKAEMNSKTKDQLLRAGGPMFAYRHKTEKKGEIVDALYNGMVREFALGKEAGVTYSLGGGVNTYEKSVRASIDKAVQALTAEDLTAFSEEISAEREEAMQARVARTEGMADPQKLEDFHAIIREKKEGGMSFTDARMSLTPEQRARFDELTAEKSREERTSSKEEKKAEVSVAGQVVNGDIIETKHTQKGHDLFVVQLSERVSREDYETLNTAAKKMGGYYSSFRGNGATPGFQFKDRDTASAFVKLAQGDKTDAQEAVNARRDAFADDRSQTAVQRLTEMADAIEERASASLNQERKTNTARRARMASGAEAAARSEQALGETMRNIAKAIESGKAKFLDRVRQKVQVQLLNTLVNNAHHDVALEKSRSNSGTFSTYEKLVQEPITVSDADHATWPQYTAYRSDLASLGRQLSEVDGTKKLGQRMLKVADDVSDAYLAFAKDNFQKVAIFKGKDGSRAAFSTKGDAEEAIARSGYRGKAIVFPVKRGENQIILSPSEAMARDIWTGDGDKKITLTPEFGAELVESIGKVNRRKNKVAVPWQFETAHERRKMLARMGIETPAEMRAALREFIGLREAPAEADKIKQMERAMIGRKNDGLDFFPTSAVAADQAIDTADIKEGMSTYEPHAGMGHIADRIREAGVEPDVGEIDSDRRELLEAKGYNIVSRDFMEMRLEDTPDGKGYDRIIMNPPFSDRRDVQHVMHAYTLLKPNGRLVSIMGEGAFFGQDKKAQAFRDWLDSVNGTDEKLAEGTFMDPSLPVNTGVNARMVVIDKPQSDEMLPNVGADKTDSAAFKKWFGDSKVVTEGGKPLVVYHGTPTGGFADFSEENKGARTGHPADDVGFHFTDSASYAEAYSGGYSVDAIETYRKAFGEEPTGIKMPPGASTYPVYLNISNPLRVEKSKQINAALIQQAKAAGHDGIIADMGGAKEYVAFRPQQIKSATGNNGAFDPANPSILGAAGGQSNVSDFDKSLYADIGAGKSSTDLLKSIATESTNPMHRELAQALMDAGVKSKIEHGNAGGKDFNVKNLPAGVTYTAGYQPKTDTVMLFQAHNAEQNILHELVHAATHKAVKAGGLNATQMKALYHHVDRSGNMKDMYGMENHDEFVAEALSNPEFQDKLRAIKSMPEGSRFANAWNWFTDVVRRAIGLPTKYANALDQALRFGRGMMDENKAANASAVDHGAMAQASKGRDILKELSKHDELFRVKRSDGDTVEAITADVDPSITVKKLSNIPGETRYNFTLPDGRTARMMVRPWNKHGNSIYGFDLNDGEMSNMEDGRPGRNAEEADGKDDVWIDVSLLNEGGGYGAKIYAIAANYAHNTGKVFIGDPAGLSDEALMRRPEQMLSSALKFGTTEHLGPHPRQIKGDKALGIGPLDWVYGDDIGNIKKLIALNLANIDNHGGNGDITYDTSKGQFTDGNGSEITREDIGGLARAGLGREAQAGGATLARSALLRSLVQGASGSIQQSDGVLAALSKQLRQYGASDGTPLEKIFYNQSTRSPIDDAREARARELGYTIKAYRGVSASDPFPEQKVFSTSSEAVARAYAEEVQAHDDAKVIAVYIKPDALKTFDVRKMTDAEFEQQEADGYGNPQGYGIYRNADDSPIGGTHTVYVAPRDQVKTLDDPAFSDNDVIMPNVGRAADSFLGKLGVQQDIRNNVSDLFQSEKTFNGWWHKSIGTQYHKAQIDHHFKRVYDSVQRYLSTVSSFANEAADFAPTLLPKLDGLRDLAKKPPSTVDTQAAGRAIFEGTLNDHKVYTDDELRSQYKLTQPQIDLYREFRAATDKSLDDMGKTDILRYAGDDGKHLTNAVLAAKDVAAGARILTEHLNAIREEDAANVIQAKADRIEQLKTQGYAPLMRFGEHTVYVTDKNGNQVFFGMAETGREAAKLARDMKETYPDATVTQGILSTEGAKLFAGISPDTIEVFAQTTGLDKNPLFQDYLKLVINNRSALKRLIERKGVAGFSQDTTRVLASFLTSNARASSKNLHGGEMSKAANDIPKEKGDVRDEAIRLVDYIQNPVEEAAKLRGLLFTNFIGGSIASAAVNMTQPVMMTLPYLSQFGGAVKAAKTLGAAMKMAAMGDSAIQDKELRDAMHKAEREGIVSPQEIHNLQAEAMRSSKGVTIGGKQIVPAFAARKAAIVWGGFFGLAEQFNRKATFIAAYQIGKGMTPAQFEKAGVSNAYEFAAKSIAETQGTYNRGNRPDWARGALGATLMTFKQYSIHYIEFLKRLPPKERALALGILVVAAGANGLPFADDLDDVIDTIGQALGYNFNSKKAKQKFATNILGENAANFVLHGFSGVGGLPLDVSMRMGMGNLLPGTGLLMKSEVDKTHQMSEFFGAAGGYGQKVLKAGDKLLSGDPAGALMAMASTAVANAAKATDMMQTDSYRDARGRKVIDTDMVDAIVKGIGFQPSNVAKEQDKLSQVRQDIAMANAVKAEIADKWAQGVFEQDTQAAAKAREAIRKWNAKNPDSPINVTMDQIAKRVRAMRTEKQDRMLKTAPKAMRANLQEELN